VRGAVRHGLRRDWRLGSRHAQVSRGVRDACKC
jgi:hypothetical protein